MQRVKLLAAVFMVAVFFFSAGSQTVLADDVNWDAFSVNLVKALKSENDGLRRSAMSKVIKYGEKLNVDEAVFDVMKVFRSNNNVKDRQLALVTLHKMQNSWAMDFLKRHLSLEKDDELKHQIQYVVYEYYGTDGSKMARDTK